MESFVDRETALKCIEDAFETLQDEKRLLRTPIIDFYGIGGIGKTSLLKKVQQRCQDEQLRCIWVDVSQGISNVSHEGIRQVQQYSIPLPPKDSNTYSLSHFISAIKTLLKRGPVVLLFDSIDTNDKEQLSWLETLLRDLSDDTNLFVVLASKRALSFENDRSLARKLTLFPLRPFDRPGCEAYLNTTGNQIETEIRDSIFLWTRGYPLALNVMVQAVTSGLDPRKDQDQKEIIAHLIDQVLNRSILARVDLKERDRYQTILSLLSIPRYFNLVIMEDLIKEFTPELALANSLEYIGLPRAINQTTEVLDWSATGIGFSVDAPVRAILSLKLKIEQPEMYYAAHRFLAQKNKKWATEVSGTDRIRYLREYLYHSACSENTETLTQLFANILQQINEKSHEFLQQLTSKFSQDEELKEVLGENFEALSSLIENISLSEG
jgi:type II secretory pathway predicted ATPase ExeA